MVRRDLPPGVALAQTVHAAGESSPGGQALPPDTHAVVLQVSGEPELLAVAEVLSKAGVKHVVIREPDSPFLGQAMTIGVEPQPRENVRHLLKHLALYK